MSTATDQLAAYGGAIGSPVDLPRSFSNAQMTPYSPVLPRRSAEAPACIKVSGFKLLIRLYAPTKRKDSLIELPQDAAELHGRASIISQVMELGPDAYVATDARPWPSGRLCGPDDWIVCRSYTGTRLKIGGREYRVINDDQVEAVVADPEQVERAI